MADLVLIKPPARHGTEFQTQNTTFRFDVTTSEAHEQLASISNHPVEEGAAISDHVRPEPFTLELTARWSATPLRESEQTPERLRRLHDEMLDFVARGESFTVVTGLRAYENMVVAHYSANRSAGIGQALDCTMELQQIRIVDEVEVDMPPRKLAPRVRPSGQDEQDKGQQTGTKLDENEETRGKSWAKHIAGWF